MIVPGASGVVSGCGTGGDEVPNGARPDWNGSQPVRQVVASESRDMRNGLNPSGNRIATLNRLG